jgi:sodium-dependent phosphate cotransporter
MPDIQEVVQKEQSQKTSKFVWIGLVLLIYCILLAVGMIGSGFKWISGGSEGAKELFAFATNPFLGLIIGTLATALVQSSSTVTSIIVGLVAGGLPVETAIPMIMGANIGTTITNSIVSLGHFSKRNEFRRAFAAATVHDFFNLICVIIFLPIELMFGILEKTSAYITQFLIGGDSLSMKGFNFIKPITKPVIGEVKDMLHVFPDKIGAAVLIGLGIVSIFIAITLIGKLLKQAMVGRAKAILHGAIGRGSISGIASGAAVTVLVQSSSTTTSLVVPLAGSGVFTTKDIYPFTLGANIGTTVTALLAATAISGEAGVFALQIAMVHLLYNVFGVSLVYGTPFLRNLPIIGAEKLAEVAYKRRSIAAIYVLSVFFIIPGALVAFTAL